MASNGTRQDVKVKRKNCIIYHNRYQANENQICIECEKNIDVRSHMSKEVTEEVIFQIGKERTEIKLNQISDGHQSIYSSLLFCFAFLRAMYVFVRIY